MRTRTIITLAVGAIALTLMLPTPRSQAMTLPAPAGIADQAQDTGLVTNVRTVCRGYWRHGRYYRRCWWVGPPRGYYYRPYRHYRHHRHYRW
jgi:hypothetical protein